MNAGAAREARSLHNQVVATGGPTVLGANTDAFGIAVVGHAPRVLNQDVITTVKQGTGVAWAIGLDSVTGGLGVNKRITQADAALVYFGSSSGKYRDHIAFNTILSYIGSTNIDNNV